MTMYDTRMKNNGLLPLFILHFTIICTVSGQEQPEIILLEASGELGTSANVTCSAEPVNTHLSWLFNGQPLNSSDVLKIYNETRSVEVKTEWKESIVFIKKTSRVHAGNYTCVATYGGQNRTKTKALDLSFPVKATTRKTVYYVNETKNDHGNNLTMSCTFEMYQDPEYVEWIHPSHMEPIKRKFIRSKENDREILSTLDLEKAGYNTDNGVFQCRVYVPNISSYVTSNISLVVYGDPTIKATAIGINTTAIYVNWTINPANSEVTKIVLLYQMENGEPKYLSNQIPVNSTSVVISYLKQATNYTVFVKVETKHGKVEHPPIVTKTLESDPVFVPIISINGFSATSVTIGITAPPKEIEQYVHYYLLEAQNKNGGAARKAYHSRDSRNLPYMFDNLQPYSTYIFKVKACQDYTKQCWDWSKEMEAATLDGVPGIPSNVKKNCSQTHMFVTWSPPDKPNAEIKGYMLEFTGTTEYRDRTGNIKKETIGPLSRFKSNDSMSARFDLQPNTQYVVRVSAMTRTRRRGDEYEVTCTTAPAPPDLPPRPRWRKMLDKDRYVLKMHLPKVSERNGPICCYRVYMVRLLGQKDLRDLPNKPTALEIINYNEAHSAQPVQGAYIADIFTNINFPVDSEVVLGDEHNIFNRSDPTFTLMGCEKCLKRPVPDVPQPKVVIVTTTVAPTTTTEDDGLTDEDTEAGREKRSEREYVQLETLDVNDGALDSTANYTAFVELIPMSMTEEGSASLYSYYLNQLVPAPTVVATAPPSTLEIALQATCGVAALILILMIGFCVMQSRRSRKMQPRGRYEMNSFPRFFSGLWGGARGCRLGGAGGGAGLTEAPPIAREDLPAAYAQRHADCDLAFQMEFELLQKLSEYITDRTTVASEARENQPKNRYPDIKAYDQTRVKLAQIDGITGSDYINANYVMGYKERKKFICAQGPTDTTVNDFWRMIWEHGLELIVMLTNLEEYSKVKCSKYWPDDVKGTRAFGHITVTHVGEKRYSDYIVRELKITKQPTNSEGQPIVENNGVAKRNGDIRDGSVCTSESGPASPRSVCGGGAGEGEPRTVRQYHFLMWKDFAAPEHPHSILKFIKRVNEAWASMLGRPVVVHCSAGVGRTGTLVALDCLLQQLNATGYVSVFNTVAELRRQRNFLVQSQKQYVFVYRALVEYAHYGDTEIAASKLRSTIDQLRNTPEGADKCMLELQFEKILNGPVTEAAKSWSAGSADELRGRNRSADCLPYDKNRVILTPIPQRDYSTYINASFVEAYDNSKGFIITQDPLPTTIFDFWRMVSEQSVSTIVMLSELGDSKCPRYWDDGTAQYEHISVQYEESEALPYYTRRQFRVTNTRSGHVQVVRQLQYQGWPTAPGHVPEVTRGLAELADAALPAPSANANANEPSEDSPMLVHCNLGTERSALFCALCVLVCTLRTERRVDVSAVARKIRAQRAQTIDTYLQYEFLHRAILNYAELHNLLEDS